MEEEARKRKEERKRKGGWRGEWMEGWKGGWVDDWMDVNGNKSMRVLVDDSVKGLDGWRN